MNIPQRALSLVVVAVFTLGSIASTGTGTGPSDDDEGPGGAGGPAALRFDTPTTSIPAESDACSGDTFGDSGELEALNTPLINDDGDVRIDALTLRYDMGSFFGEPTRSGIIAWEGEGGLYDILWAAEVLTADGGAQYTNGRGQRVYASYLLGAFPDAGDGFGFDTTGSPNWTETFMVWDESAGALAFGVEEGEAKDIYRACFRLGDLYVLGINDEGARAP